MNSKKFVKNPGESKTLGNLKEKLAAKKAGTAPAKEKQATVKEKLTAKKDAINNAAKPKPTTTGTIREKLAAKKAASTPAKPAPAPAKPAPVPAKPAPAPVAETPAMQKKSVSKKTAYNIKEASNPKLSASARKHYAMNAQAAMKNKKKK